LSGYAALFKHPNDEVNYCLYLLPGNPKVLPDDLPYWHDKMMKDPFISKGLGNEYKIERMKAGVLSFITEVPSHIDLLTTVLPLLPRDASAEHGYEIACRPSVRPFVTFRYQEHIGWNSSKIISRPNSLRPLLWLTHNMGDLVQREHSQN